MWTAPVSASASISTASNSGSLGFLSWIFALAKPISLAPMRKLVLEVYMRIAGC